MTSKVTNKEDIMTAQHKREMTLESFTLEDDPHYKTAKEWRPLLSR